MNVSDEVRVSPRLSCRAAEIEAPENERHHDDLDGGAHLLFTKVKKTALVRSPLTALTAATYCFSFVTAQERWTPLHSAASAGHAPVVASLLAFGAAPNAANSGGQRAAHYAASKGRVEVLRKLRDAGADCDARDATGATPCHRAASTGMTDIIEFLITETRADIEGRNSLGQTPLIVACEADRREAVLRLARLGADADAVDDERNGAATLAPELMPALRSIKQGDVE